MEKLTSETPFLAVILRLMTFLLPYLYHLQPVDFGIAARFCRVAVLVMENCGSHPVVQTEAMAFWEVLSNHRDLLPEHAGGVKYDEHPILCSIPFLMASINPETTLVHPRGLRMKVSPFLPSGHCLRSMLKLIEVLSSSEVLVAEWSDMKIVALLFAALEKKVGCTLFAGETSHRNVAAPRDSDVVYHDGDPTGGEIFDTVRLLLYLESSLSRSSMPVLLRYFLLARSLLTGSSSSTGDDDDDDEEDAGVEYNVQNVSQTALGRSASDALPVLKYANPPRWQVKTLAVQMATIALSEMRKKCIEDGQTLPSSPDFNPVLAMAECKSECVKARAANKPLPESKLALHIGAAVTAACVTATATMDQAELRILQESALHLLVQVIECFGGMPDPDQKDAMILYDYIPQISSCIKSALGAPGEQEGEMPCRLFLVGCEALRAFVKSQVTTDRGVLKRIIRPVLPTADEVWFQYYDNSMEGHHSNVKTEMMNQNLRSSLLIKIGKLSTLGSLPIFDPDISSMLEVDKAALGADSAAMAIDGARLLLASRLSLCGYTNDESEAEIETAKTGFYYKHLDEIDSAVMSALVKEWSTCAAMSVTFLSQTIASDKTANDTREGCKVWLRHVVPLLFAGLDDALRVQTSKPSKVNLPNWVKGIDDYQVAARCLDGITELTANPMLLQLDETWMGEVESCLAKTSDSVLIPCLQPESTPGGDISRQSGSNSVLVEKSCSLLQKLASSPVFSFADDSSLLLSLLRPLGLLQNGKVNVEAHLSATIISASLTAIAGVVSADGSSPTLVNAMISLCLDISSNQKKTIGSTAENEGLPKSVATASRSLLKACLTHKSLTAQEHSMVLSAVAKSGDWQTWSDLVRVNDGVAAERSLGIAQAALVNSNIPEQQIAIVTSLQALFQSVTPPNVLIGRVACAVGADIFSIFQAYGTLQVLEEARVHRTVICAGCVKIALVAYQQFSSDTSEEELAAFLVILFQTFIAVLRFNGLPNHPPPQGGLSDPAIGRMCAQSILHVARTTPVPFKASMAGLSEQDRAVLEFAVRAEMTGYAGATASSAPAPKKKLNLKNFKK